MLSHISTHSVANALRLSLQNMQRDLAKAQQETVTGQVADPGLALGARNGQRISLLGDARRLSSILETNNLAASRLTVTQDSVSQISERIQDMMASLTQAISGTDDPSVIANGALSTMGGIASILNTTHNGDYVFAGINTDARPMADYQGSGMQAAINNAFTAYFGFAKTDPAAQSITAADMRTFLDAQVEPLFAGATWSTLSSAADDVIRSRITLTQSAATSISANEAGFRNAAYAMAITAEFFDSNLAGAARAAVAEKSLSIIGDAVGEMANLQSRVGFVQQRVSEATERIKLQSERLASLGNDLAAVDPYEAATKLNALLTQIETSYSITQRVQNLSLLRYL